MRHVIWDWNGTLVDDLPVVVDAVNVSLAAVGESPITADDYRDHYTRPVRLFYDRMLERNVSDEEWETINTVFHDTYVDTLHRVPLTHDAWQAIEKVKTGGGTQSILSMWWHDDLVPEVKRHGVDQAMIRVDGNIKDAGEGKARLLGIHLANLGNSNKPVLVGDAFDDAAAARSAGIDCIMYDGGSHHREQLEALGFPVAGSLLEAASIALQS